MKKYKLSIPNPLSPIWNYLKIHLGRAKSEADAEARALYSLNIVGSTLLIVGLFTSFSFIVPTVLQVTGFVFPFWASVVSGVIVCAGYAAMIDLSIGVNTPFAFHKWSSFLMSPSYRSAFAALPMSLLIFGQCSLSMWFSYDGNTYTTEWLLQDESPTHSAAVLVSLDSAKHASEEAIRKANEDNINTALTTDKAELAKAAKIVEDAKYKAMVVYPKHETNGSWDQQQYKKAVNKAKRDSSDLMYQHGDMHKLELNKLDDKIRSNNALFAHQIQSEKEQQKSIVDKYERKLKTYRLLLRDLGYYATVGFVIISLIIVLIQGGENPPTTRAPRGKADKETETDKESLQAAKKHVTTYIKRFNDAVEGNNKESAETNAAALLSHYETIKKIDEQEFIGLMKRQMATQPAGFFYDPSDIIEIVKNM